MSRDGFRNIIIEYIQNNRVSTTEVADCLGKSYGFASPEMLPINKGHFIVGETNYLYAVEGSNWNIHEDLHNNKYSDSVIFIDAIDVEDRALVGDLVSKYCLLYLSNRAIVTNGKMRDAHRLIKENYPIWCSGVSPVGCFNTKPEHIDKYDIQIKERKNNIQGAVTVCDDSGVVIIPKDKLNEDFYNKLIEIEKQEDIWYECVDARKWSTFDTVCMKRYMNNNKD